LWWWFAVIGRIKIGRGLDVKSERWCWGVLFCDWSRGVEVEKWADPVNPHTIYSSLRPRRHWDWPWNGSSEENFMAATTAVSHS